MVIVPVTSAPAPLASIFAATSCDVNSPTASGAAVGCGTDAGAADGGALAVAPPHPATARIPTRKMTLERIEFPPAYHLCGRAEVGGSIFLGAGPGIGVLSKRPTAYGGPPAATRRPRGTVFGGD